MQSGPTIYPQPTHGLLAGTSGEPPAAPERKSVARPDSLWRVLLRRLLMLLAGTVAIGLLGLCIGAIAGEGAIAPVNTKFAAFGYVAYFLIVLPIEMALFGAIAYVTKNKLYLVYPIVAYVVAGALQDETIVTLIGGYVPVLDTTVSGVYSRVHAAIVVLLAFMVAHMVVSTAGNIIREYTTYNHTEAPAARQFAVGWIMLGVVIMLISGVAAAAPALYAAQQRSRAAVHIPSGGQVYGGPAGDIYNLQYRSYALLYAEPTQQFDGLYQQQDSVVTSQLSKWWQDDPRKACGGTFAKTKGGVVYAEHKTTKHASQPPKKTTEYHTYAYCFVKGYRVYTLHRSDTRGDAYLQRYPAAQIIDAITTAPAFIPGCEGRKAAFYCQKSDAKANTQLAQTAKAKRTAWPPTDITRQNGALVSQLYVNPRAYTEVGRLQLPGWNVSVPLAAETKDAYAIAAGVNRFTVNLQSFTTPACTQSGVAYITRTKLSDLVPLPNIQYEGKIIGDYLYSLRGPFAATPGPCIASATKDAVLIATLEDIFRWAAGNIH